MISEARNEIRIAVVVGTVRPGNYTAMATNLVVEELKQHGVGVDIIDLASVALAFPGAPNHETSSRAMQERLKNVTGIVLATPEYHGTFSAALKLAIENMGFPSVLAGKPVALLGVAAGAIGAIKSLEQLRGVCSHVGAIVLPGPVSVAGVQKVFDAEGKCSDAAVEKRIRQVANGLLEYIHKSVCPSVALERMVREGTMA